jgi:glycerol-3-phosphate cytidylyltransferase
MMHKFQIGFTCGAFDLMHAGHILMFQEAKEQCDYLIVGLQTDPSIDRPSKNKPVESVTERYIKLKAVRWVDEIVPYTTEQDLVSMLQMLPIDVRIVGADYIGKDFTGKQYCEDQGIQIHYNSRSHNLSTSDIRARVVEASGLVPQGWIEP